MLEDFKMLEAEAGGGDRPKRGSATKHQVIYQECDSDDEDFQTIMFLKGLIEAEKQEAEVKAKKAKIVSKVQVDLPPLTPLQTELREICKRGDKDGLKTFLANNPDVDLDFRSPDGDENPPLLHEVVSKNEQYVDIARMLLDAGADIDATDSNGTTALVLACGTYPATMLTVDMLLSRGADITKKNVHGVDALYKAKEGNSKELYEVLQKLMRQKRQKTLSKRTRSKNKSYKDSPDLRKLVVDPLLNKDQKIVVKFNSPRSPASPGVLKRKRPDDNDDENEILERRGKRIKFCSLDSLGAHIDPDFSDDDDLVDHKPPSPEKIKPPPPHKHDSSVDKTKSSSKKKSQPKKDKGKSSSPEAREKPKTGEKSSCSKLKQNHKSNSKEKEGVKKKSSSSSCSKGTSSFKDKNSGKTSKERKKDVETSSRNSKTLRKDKSPIKEKFIVMKKSCKENGKPSKISSSDIERKRPSTEEKSPVKTAKSIIENVLHKVVKKKN